MKWQGVLAAVMLLVVMHPREGSALDIFPLMSCAPDCSGVADVGLVADPKNCTQYYYCMNGEPLDHPESCDPGNHFDAEILTCVPPEDCESLCSPLDGCALTCNGTGSLIGDPSDCKKYYYCTPSGISDTQICPNDKPHFDGNNCVNDDSVCCSGYCEALCPGNPEAMFIPDPNSCTDFYVCPASAEGAPDESLHHSCGSGQYFNYQVGACVSASGTPCVTLCELAEGKDGSTPTTRTTLNSGGDTTSSVGCVGSLTCPAAGNYAACNTCQSQYFSCTAAGVPGLLTECTDNKVFNTNPSFPYCVLPTNCPYPS